MTDISVMGEWEVVGVGGTRPLRNVLGEALKGRFSFEARNYLFSFPSYVHFEEFFCFPRFCKIWRQMFEPWGFWFRRCLGALFENCAPSLGIFLRTPTTTQSIFWKFLFFFQSRAGVCLTALVIPRLSKALWWLEWKLDFRALARSSAEGLPIVVAFSTSRLRWSRWWSKETKARRSQPVITLYRQQNQRGNQRVLRSLFPRPDGGDVSTVLLFAVFLYVAVQ